MKKRISIRLVASLVLSAMLFTLPAVALLVNRNTAIPVYADDENTAQVPDTPEVSSEGVSANAVPDVTAGAEAEKAEEASDDKDTNDDPQDITDRGIEETDNTENEEKPEDTGDTKEDENTDRNYEETCICGKKCTQYDHNSECPVCSKDYTKCAYKEPSVSILIKAPTGWMGSGNNAKVTFEVKDIADTGNFVLKEVKAKIGQNGSYTDVTEDMSLEISENCTVYAMAVDVNGKGYERSRAIKCFDTVRPTLNAAVSDGLLSIQAVDSESGVKLVYVNGYEFNEFTNGTINIRLSQFDAGYEYFTIQAMDVAGNMSEVYKTKNPYYKDPESNDNNDPAKQLPVSAEATKPATATAKVTEHTDTGVQSDVAGSKTTQASSAMESQKKTEPAAADPQTLSPTGNGQDMNQGKEFYTIESASGKVFYLIIDRDGQEEVVHFLTEITENDLLNVTSDNSETLPKNSAALESQIPVIESALPNNNTDQDITQEVEISTEETMDKQEGDNSEETESGEDSAKDENTEEEEPVRNNTALGYIILVMLGAGVIGSAYYVKVIKKKQDGDFVEDEDDDDDDSKYDDDEEVKEDESAENENIYDLPDDNEEEE